MSWSAAVSLHNIASDTAYSLRNLRCPRVTVANHQLSCISDGLVEVDLVIDRSEIKSVEPAGSGVVLTTDIDMAHAMVWPCMVDCHTHLDKGQVWSRSPNADGNFDGASQAAYRESMRPAFTTDVYKRVEFRYVQPTHMAHVQFALTLMETPIISVKYLTNSRNFQIPGPIA